MGTGSGASKKLRGLLRCPSVGSDRPCEAPRLGLSPVVGRALLAWDRCLLPTLACCEALSRAVSLGDGTFLEDNLGGLPVPSPCPALCPGWWCGGVQVVERDAETVRLASAQVPSGTHSLHSPSKPPWLPCMVCTLTLQVALGW